MEFNSAVSPKAKTELFKIYVDVGTTASSPEFELQGRGVTSWTIENGQELTVTPDVLGFNDFERGTPKPQQSVELAIRKGSKLGLMLFEAWLTGDMSKLDSMKILQKFEFIDGSGTDTCVARLQDECAMNITSFIGEAENYLKFAVDIYYSNKITMGTMPKTDGAKITFTESAAAASVSNDE